MIDGGLRGVFRGRLPDFHWNTIENGVGRGIPDAEFCAPGGVTGWIEYKFTGGSVVAIAPEQIAWHLRRARNGGKSYIAVRRKAAAGKRREARDELWLVKGAGAEELARDGLLRMREEIVIGRWSGGIAKWNWEEVQKILIT